MKYAALIFLPLMFAAGCSDLNAEYIRADRDTFDTLQPALERDGVAHPETLRVRNGWKRRLEEAEKSLKPAAPQN